MDKITPPPDRGKMIITYVSLRSQKSQGSQTGHMVTFIIGPEHTSRVGVSRSRLQISPSILPGDDTNRETDSKPKH